MLKLLGVLLLAACSPGASSAQVVAFGTGLTRGYDLPLSQAYPAQLEAVLRQHGIDVSVTNEGVDGDTTIAMLGRLDAATPEGTKVVVLNIRNNDTNGPNEKKGGLIDTEGNITSIVDRLRARGIVVVVFASTHLAAVAEVAGAATCGNNIDDVPEDRIGESGIHLTPHGYGVLAERLFPCVMRALRSTGSAGHRNE